MGSALLRTYRAVQPLKPSQVAARIARVPKRAILRRWGRGYLGWIGRGKSVPRVSPLPRLLGLSSLSGGDARAARSRAAPLFQRRFRLLNHEEPWGNPIDWDRRDANFLWRYTLNGFGFAVDLGLLSVLDGDRRAYPTFRDLAASWIDGNPCGATVGWDPYPTSKRIVSWIYASRLFDRDLWEDSGFAAEFLKSLSDQVLFLDRNLERHLGGNHLWENLWAITLAGFYFDNADGARWRAKGTEGLWREVRDQILEDGGHFERSPHYHAVLLKSLLELKMILKDLGQALPEDVEERLRGMLRFLAGILHPDGGIPLFNDSVLGETDATDLLHLGAVLFGEGSLKREGESFGLWPELWLGPEGRSGFEALPVGASPRSRAFPATGYYVLSGTGGSHVVVDAGPLGPDSLPGHGHADTLSLELSLGPLRFVVDSGVGAYYGEQAWRDYERGTRAHNTVEIDGEDQSELWGQFRVGRRARPREVGWFTDGPVAGIRASHDGYDHLRGHPRHTRTVLQSGRGYGVIVDEIRGSGSHGCVGRLHFHPECEVEGTAELGVRVRRGDRALLLRWAPGVRLTTRKGERNPIQGWVASEFGKRVPGWVVESTVEGALPLIQAVVLVPVDGGAARAVIEEGGEALSVRIEWAGAVERIRLGKGLVSIGRNAYSWILQ